MRSYPIRVPRVSYRGADPRKKWKRDNANRVAGKIETYINDEMKQLPADSVHVFCSYEIASSIMEDSDMVQDLVFGIDAGSNGVTVYKGDYEKALANPQ
ncbi:hypothetical protein [Brevundimonas sp. A19_0]|uniref:hypothetical protein n=1 Tax=Brevundimonas sp. A19_0 TaxID=2821087 RepID=UPI001ADCD60A|nr:hypothetical protein [Brevundimonas sp. A19_0]MBO9502584.1 hypothetical protein [Brevundimonas sp. A19_0]